MNKTYRKERRRNSRVAGSLPLTFQLINRITKRSLTSKLQGQSVDFSEMGLCLETNNVIADGIHVITEGMDPNNLIEVEISVPDESTPLVVYANILRYDLASENASRRLRVYMKIKNIDPESQEKWNKLLHKQKGLKDRVYSLFRSSTD